jgi:hypothetical protein
MDFFRPGDYGSGRYVAGAITLSNAYARSGKQSVQITVKTGDIKQTGGDDKLTERAELDSGGHPILDRDAWYGFSFLIPNGFPVVDNRLVIAQWKQSSLIGGPLVAQRFRNGQHYLTVRRAESGRNDKKYSLPTLEMGKWNDMVYHIRFSLDDGYVEVWMNGTQIVSHQGPTAFKDGENGFYNKFGLYRDRWEEPMTIYFDNYTLGDSFETVNPARYDQSK